MTKKVKSLTGIITAFFVCFSFLTSCNATKADPLSYNEILENGLLQSKETILEQCGLNEENLQKEAGRGDSEVWYPEETVSIAGYDMSVRLDFRNEDDALMQATYTLEFRGDHAFEDGYEAMLALYDDLYGRWGAAGYEGAEPEKSPQEKFGDYDDFYQMLLDCEDGWADGWSWSLEDYGERFYGGLSVGATKDQIMSLEINVRQFNPF